MTAWEKYCLSALKGAASAMMAAKASGPGQSAEKLS